MPYEVLSRKYRPDTFKKVVYQDFIVHSLKNSIKTNRLGHAYLFFGSRGVGKTSVARIFAKAINCYEPVASEPCNQCVSCSEITKGISVNVFEIDAASHRGINHIRELRDNVKFTPTNAKFKIYIIDEVHMLTTESFNALLKTLEEPPSHVIFILATTEFHKIPETILSRCQDFTFRKIPSNILKDYLKKLCKENNLEYDEEGLFWIAKKGDGSLRDSLSFMEQAISFTNFQLLGKNIREMIEYNGVDQLSIFLKDLLELQDSKKCIQIIQQLFEKGSDLQNFFWNLVEFSHTIVLLKKNIPIDEISTFPKDDLIKIKNDFENIDIIKINYISTHIFTICEELKSFLFCSSFEEKVFFEIQIFRLIENLNQPTLSGILTRLNSLSYLIQSDSENLEKTEKIELKQNPKKIEDIVLKKEKQKVPSLEFQIKEKFLGTEVPRDKHPNI